MEAVEESLESYNKSVQVENETIIPRLFHNFILMKYQNITGSL